MRIARKKHLIQIGPRDYMLQLRPKILHAASKIGQSQIMNEWVTFNVKRRRSLRELAPFVGTLKCWILGSQRRRS